MAASPRAPITALVLAAVAWGAATTATKYALGAFAPVTLLAIELLAANALLWILVLLRGYRRPGSWRRVMLLGLLEPALAYLSETAGLARTTASNGALLLGLESAAVVILAAVILREPMTRSVTSAVLLAAAGLVVLEGSDAFSGPGLGDLLVVAGVLCAAMFTIVARSAAGRVDGTADGTADETDSLTLTAHQFAVASVAITPAALLQWHRGAEPMPLHVPLGFWLAAIGVGTIGYALSFVLYNWAIVSVEAGPSAVILNLIPAFGLLTAVLFLGESLSLQQAVGAGLVGGSVLLFGVVERECSPSAVGSTDQLQPTLTNTG
ncbi:threonine/homoserine efflux transporter RhtA [Jatrophihabitans sp. GAS493]|uniref:DMT family transporter n=1 Tax=Jatrophihabitans sp. GAS493 TaxID=1907575 RepID=UPI000BB7258A|nr:DMT family transporter [Jatrophihabitans sp. GAS493]SOD71249.1 threonine/homoserine efflux transporter RhtA [Jatrophihabitans sp. GAS493]